ncbi:MAG: aminotransferase class I/II-fold pyridoxal phosphate-dependent enzyme [Nitrososphaeria archaeon]
MSSQIPSSRDFHAYIKARLKDMEANDLLWRPRTLEGPSTVWTRVQGRKVLVLSSNNYLSLSTHPRLIEATMEAIKKYGVGSGSVRAIAGTMKLHLELEEKLAEYKRKEASIVFPSGFMANSGSIPALVGQGDLIVSDELNHGSIIDGVRLARADRMIFPHKNVEKLEQLLEENSPKYNRILIITDGVFSMDGDIAPVPGLNKVAKEYGAMLYVDDAHGDGVLGESGRGVVSHFGLEGEDIIEMGTFSKAYGVVGGYISASGDIISYLKNAARTYLLTGSTPPPVAAACRAALEVCESEPQLIESLWKNTRYFKDGLRKLGFNIGQSETPITPIIIGDNARTNRMAEEIFEKGILVLPIVYPMVAQGTARIRTQVNAKHTIEDLDLAMGVFERVAKKLGII